MLAILLLGFVLVLPVLGCGGAGGLDGLGSCDECSSDDQCDSTGELYSCHRFSDGISRCAYWLQSCPGQGGVLVR